MKSFRLLASLVAVCAFGCGTPSFLVTPVQNTNKLQETSLEPGRGSDRIAIVEVEGMLSSLRTGGLLQPTENKVSLLSQKLRKAADDNRVKAVVLRINSPGGTVTASDTMYSEVLRFRQETGKPVVAYAQDVAASGGYYVACAADKIVAHPTSVVGSIGVIFNTMEVSSALSFLGVKNDAIKSGPLKDMGSPFRPMGVSERLVMQEMVDDFFARFKGVVAESRGLAQGEPIDKVSDGRVFTGTQALSMGLVDANGQLRDALDMARSLSNAPNARGVLYSRPFGYGGSIFASAEVPQPQAARTPMFDLQLPETWATLPSGFYYLWKP